MSNEIHPLVMATIENERARRELELERLRSAREACVTSSAGGQNRAMALGKKIRQLEEITGSWRLVLATVLGAMDEMTEAAEGATPAFQELATMLGETEETPQVEFPDGSTIPGETDEQFKRRMDLTGPLRVVGSKSPLTGKLRCVPCTEANRERYGSPGRLIDVTSEDLPDGGMCATCSTDVLGAMDEMTEAAKREIEAPLRVVGARTRRGQVRCVPCTQDFRTLNPHNWALTDVTAEDLPEGGVCVGCGKDVLA